MLNIFVVEDDPAIFELLAFFLQKNNLSKKIYHAKSAEGAKAQLASAQLDFFFLDINLSGEEDGIQFGQWVRKHFNRPIIFISSVFDRFTIEKAKKVSPDGYLVKPFKEQDIIVALEMALHRFNDLSLAPLNPQTADTSTLDSKEDSLSALADAIFVLRKRKVYHKVFFADLLWVEADRNYTIFRTKEETFSVRCNLKAIEAKLPKQLFFRLHKSYVVNLRQVTSIDPDFVQIADEQIPIGKDMHQQLVAWINAANR